MELNKETQKLVSKAISQWDKLKLKQSGKEEYGTEFKTPIGQIHWDNPTVVWVYASSNEEGYEGSQIQIGLNKTGNFVWEYQSHCSCNGYEDTKEELPVIPEDTTKSYELGDIPKDFEAVIQFNLKKLLSDE